MTEASAPETGEASATRLCPICEKHEGRGPLVAEVIYEDPLVRASHAVAGPDGAYLGHLIVDLRRHVRGLAERSDEEATAEGRLVNRLAKVLETFGAEVVYSFVFDHIPHHHVHVIARYPGTPRQYWGARVDEWPDAPKGDPDAVAEYSARIRRALLSE